MLPDYGPIFVPGRIGPSAALVILTRRPIVGEPRHLRLSNGLFEGGRGLRKGALSCTIDGVELVNFHLRANPKGQRDPLHPRVVAQAAQVDALIAFVNSLQPGPKVVAGDSNIEWGGDLYCRLVEGARLINPFDGTATISALGGGFCVDFIFIAGWGEVDTQTSHLFTGRTAEWTKARQWRRMGVVSDHEGLSLRLTCT